MQDIQEKVKEFCEKHGLQSPPEHRILDTMSELGEVAKEVLKMTDYGRKPAQQSENLKSEMGDLLYCIITIANDMGIDLEEALDMVLDKYEKRLAKGGAGSEND